MNVEPLPIKKGEWLIDALKRENYQAIPTNVILDKKITGIGATSCEIDAFRNSIIIEPNVPVITGKADETEAVLAVYEKCTPKAVEKYMQSNIAYKKILTTPEGFSKIRKAAANLDINIYKDYFCLFDECEKIVQDVDYRINIIQPIYDFFEFEQKAFVSATPLEMRHPKFEETGFRIMRVVPDFDYKKNIELIVTNSYDTSVREIIKSYESKKCVCIFLNKTDSINKIIASLNLKDYKIFCSEKSVNKLKERDFDNSFENIDLPLAKYNFFTSRFFSALDIKIKDKPDILILTNLNDAIHTMIDPYTEAIQIIGRFRNGFTSVTHISNINPNITIRSRAEINARISQFESIYNQIKEFHSEETDRVRKQAIFEDLVGLTYNNFIDEKGNINYFSIDNLYNEERVKSYYTSANNLHRAYVGTEYFNVAFSNAMVIVGSDDILKLQNAVSDIEKRKIIIAHLEKLSHSLEKQIINEDDFNYFKQLLKKEKEGEYTIATYEKIGKVGFEKEGYLKKGLDAAVKKYDKEQAEIKRFSPEIWQDIKAEFELNVYMPKKEIQSKLMNIYEKHSIKYKVVQDTILDYYRAHTSNSKNPPSHKLLTPKWE